MKYQDLALEMSRMWNVKTSVIPIVIGALGAKHRLLNWLALHGVQEKRYHIIQQAALLGLAHILRKVQSISV